ncbi:MAG: helix-turn-helix domain-containing protein [Gammaproteobacteria bacterium]|nr:helix-turn-helix domain-containing protein [Gammaproteobacteria bacterium]
MQELAEKLSHLLRANQLSQNDLAEKIGVSKQVINSLCSGKVKNSKALYPIAKYFKVEYDWLTNKINEESISPEQNGDILVLDKFHKIPLLSTRVLNTQLLHNGKLKLDDVMDDFELTNDPEYQNLFALLSTNNSLKFRFGDNCLLIFHTSLAPANHDFVIAHLAEKELFVYRDLIIHNQKKTLIPVDEDIYKPITMKDHDKIVAVLYEKRIKRPFTE